MADFWSPEFVSDLSVSLSQPLKCQDDKRAPPGTTQTLFEADCSIF